MEKVLIGQRSNEVIEHKGIMYIGELSTRTDTVEADVLAWLLDSGKPLTSMAVARVHGRNIQLSAIIEKLENKHVWNFVRTAQEEYTSDGRRIWTIGYVLPPAAIELAGKLNYFAWTAAVKYHRAINQKPTLSKPEQVQLTSENIH